MANIDVVKRLREICLALPETSEKIAWGDPTWRIRDRIFAMQKGNYDGGRPSLWLKGAEGAQAALVSADAQRFFVPPYVGHKGWIGVYLDAPRIDWAVLASLIEESYRLIAPKRVSAARLAAPTAAAKKKKQTQTPTGGLELKKTRASAHTKKAKPAKRARTP